MAPCLCVAVVGLLRSELTMQWCAIWYKSFFYYYSVSFCFLIITVHILIKSIAKRNVFTPTRTTVDSSIHGSSSEYADAELTRRWICGANRKTKYTLKIALIWLLKTQAYICGKSMCMINLEKSEHKKILVRKTPIEVKITFRQKKGSHQAKWVELSVKAFYTKSFPIQNGIVS